MTPQTGFNLKLIIPEEVKRKLGEYYHEIRKLGLDASIFFADTHIEICQVNDQLERLRPLKVFKVKASPYDPEKSLSLPLFESYDTKDFVVTDPQRFLASKGEIHLARPDRVVVTETLRRPRTKKMDGPKRLRIIPYSERSFVLVGDTKPYRSEIKRMGGKYNPFLKVPDAETAWVFSKKREEEVQKFLSKIK